MWNCGDHGIQSAADAVIRNNIILGSAADGIAMQPHQAGSPSNLVVTHNTVLHANNDAISVRSIVGSVVLANNALYAQNGRAIFVSGGDTGLVTVLGNVGVGGQSGGSGLTPGDLGRDFAAAHYAGVPPIDVFPAVGGGLIGSGDLAHVAAIDFNGTERGQTADVGAYAFDPGGNPGWTITEAFNGSPALGSGPDAQADSGPSGSDAGVDVIQPGDTGLTPTTNNVTGECETGCSAGTGRGVSWTTGLGVLVGLLGLRRPRRRRC